MAKSLLIVGGGIVGTAAALRLKVEGFDVALVDPGDMRQGASFGNIGHIAVEQVEPLASWATLAGFPRRLFAFGGALDFRMRDAALWLPWSLRLIAASRRRQFEIGTAALSALQRETMSSWRRLAALAGAPDLLRADGHAVVWMSTAAAKRGIAAWAKANTGTTRVREMNAADLEVYRGALRVVPAGGVRFIGSGQFEDPQTARDVLVAAFRARGGTMVRASVVDLRVDEGGVIARLDSGEVRRADEVLIAAGVWSRRLMALFGSEPALIAEHGYSVHSTEHAWPAGLPPTVFEERSLVVSRFSSGLRASSFLELGGPQGPGDVRKWRWLERQLDDLGIAFSRTPDRWVGPRPSLPDFLPAIGRLRRCPRVLYAFGHQHLGMTLAAATADIVVDLAGDARPAIDVNAFRIERFERS